MAYLNRSRTPYSLSLRTASWFNMAICSIDIRPHPTLSWRERGGFHLSLRERSRRARVRAKHTRHRFGLARMFCNRFANLCSL